MIPFSLPGFPGFFHEMEVKKMMKERKKLVLSRTICSMINHPSTIKIIIHLLLIICIHHQRSIIKRGQEIALDIPYVRGVFVHAV